MIPKMHSGNNFYGVLNYLESKRVATTNTSETSDKTQSDKGFERLGVFNLLANPSDSKAELANGFQSYNESVQTKKSKTQKPVFHASLSLKEEENISNGKFLELAGSFMKRMGYENQPYVVYRHFDKAHPHIHIVSSRIGQDGKKINDSNEAKRAIKVCRDLEVQYSLISVKDLNSQGSSKSSVLTESPPPYDTKISFKKNIVDHLSYVLRKYPGLSLAALNRYLINNGIELETSLKNGKNVVIFYGLNKAGQRISRLPGSAIGNKLFDRISAVTKPDRIHTQQGFDRKAILDALTDINKAEIINEAVIKAGLHSNQLKLVKVKSLNIPNGAKVAEIMQKADLAEKQLQKFISKGKDFKESLQEIQKRHGFSFYAFLTNTGKPVIVYREKGKSVFVTDYMTTEFKRLLYQNLIPGNEVIQKPDDLYLKPNSALNDLLAPKLAIVYELLNKNNVFGLSNIMEAGKLVGLDLSIHSDENGLKGLTIIYQGRFVKTSLLSYDGKSLSSIEIKPKFRYQYSGAADLHLNNEQINRLNDKPQLNSLMTDIIVQQGNVSQGLSSFKDKMINNLLADIQMKYVHPSEIKHSIDDKKGTKEKPEVASKKSVRSMASWLHKGVTNKGIDDLSEDLYTLKVN